MPTKAWLPACGDSTDRELHRKGRAVLAPSHHLASGADDLRHAGREIGRNVAVVFAMVWLRHQDADVLPDDLVRGIAEQADAGLVEGLNDAVMVDGNQAVHHRVENGGDQTAEPGFARLHHRLGGDSLGDVAGDLAEGAQGAVGRSDGGDDNIGQETRAILAHALADILEAAGRRSDLELTLRPAGRDILRWVEAGKVPADDFLGAIALDQLRPSVPRHDAAVRIEQQQRIVVHRGDECGPEALFIGVGDSGGVT